MSVSSKSTGRKTVDTATTSYTGSTFQATATAQSAQVISPNRGDITVNKVDVSPANSRPSTASPNGANAAPPNRASPVPNQAGTPNGKPTSPVATSNAMPNGDSTAPQTVSSKDPKAAAQAATDMRNIVRRKLTGYVGFANLPNQWHRKSVRKGFNFNVMVVGEFVRSRGSFVQRY